MKLLLIPLFIFLSGCSNGSSRAWDACFSYVEKVSGEEGRKLRRLKEGCEYVKTTKTGLFGILYEEKYIGFFVDEYVEKKDLRRGYSTGGYWTRKLKRKWKF